MTCRYVKRYAVIYVHDIGVWHVRVGFNYVHSIGQRLRRVRPAPESLSLAIDPTGS
jgi:hypothetical protein